MAFPLPFIAKLEVLASCIHILSPRIFQPIVMGLFSSSLNLLQHDQEAPPAYCHTHSLVPICLISWLTYTYDYVFFLKMYAFLVFHDSILLWGNCVCLFCARESRASCIPGKNLATSLGIFYSHFSFFSRTIYWLFCALSTWYFNFVHVHLYLYPMVEKIFLVSRNIVTIRTSQHADREMELRWESVWEGATLTW